jgi:hypothetical protein
MAEASNLYWSFGVNASEASVAVGEDGTVVSTFVSDKTLSWAISAAFGITTNSQSQLGFNFVGTDSNFDTGDAPSAVAIDPNGVAVSIHESNGASADIWMDVGSAIGGQGGFQSNWTGDLNTAYEINNQFASVTGQCPSIIAIGPRSFLLAALGSDLSPSGISAGQLQLWSLTGLTTSNEGVSFAIQPVSLQVSSVANGGPENGSPTSVSLVTNNNTVPRLAYSNGVLAIAGVKAGGNPEYGSNAWGVLGTYSASDNTFTVQLYLPNQYGDGVGYEPGVSVALDGNNNLYMAGVWNNNNSNSAFMNVINYNPGNNWTWTSQTFGWSNVSSNDDLFGGTFSLPPNYCKALDIDYTVANGYNGIIMSVLSYCNCVDLFYFPFSLDA